MILSHVISHGLSMISCHQGSYKIYQYIYVTKSLSELYYETQKIKSFSVSLTNISESQITSLLSETKYSLRPNAYETNNIRVQENEASLQLSSCKISYTVKSPADKGWSSSLEVWRGAKNFSP